MLPEDPCAAVDPAGRAYRDLNGNGVLDPFEDASLDPHRRTADLLTRLSLAEKVGLLFHTVIEANQDGTLLQGPGAISKSGTAQVVTGKYLNHFNVHRLPAPRLAARWSNALQHLAASTPHGIPVTVSTDPRHSFSENAGASFTAGAFSQWPEPAGLAAIDDVAVIADFAEHVRREYVAVGIRAALHPQIDLATEPRWARQLHSWGQDPHRTSAIASAYVRGLQRDQLGADSVACTAKHFPGGGPQAGGEDAHFPYGREQVYPGGRFDDHLEPFRAAIAAGVSAVMPYYGMPVGLEVEGEPIESVGFSYNRQIVTDLLRDRLGFDGVVLTDWELINDNHVGDQVLPARAWGVEELDPPQRALRLLDAGCDQFGGEECTDLIIELVNSGRLSPARIDESAARILLVKFQLGLFDNPFVDEDQAELAVGNPAAVAAGLRAQAESVTVLENKATQRGAGTPGEAAATAGGAAPILPLRGREHRLYVEGIDAAAVAGLGIVVPDPAQADLALIRIQAPFEPRDDLFLEAWFHQGSLEFRPGLIARLERIAQQVPVIIDVALDRPAVLSPLVPIATALVVSFGTSGPALVAALTGDIAPRGTLPVGIPATMDAVRAGLPDAPAAAEELLYQAGYGLTI